MISKQLTELADDTSWIRKMFTKGSELKALRGEHAVFDYSIGNPAVEPPLVVNQQLVKLVTSGQAGVHRYLPSQGLPEARLAIASALNSELDSEVRLDADHVVMCSGAGAGINVVLKTLVDPGDGLMVFAPFFPEYRAYASSYGACFQAVPTDKDFQLDFDRISAAIDESTKVVLINSPNNPSGVVYSADSMQRLAEILEEKSRGREEPIILLSDEPYRKILFDGVRHPCILDHYAHSILVTSFSKDLALPGERIGYIAVSPQCYQAKTLVAAMVSATRIMGFVNAPALMQRLVASVQDVTIDLKLYEENRNLLHSHLIGIGFECVLPKGAFYLFPKSPVPNDVDFVQEAVHHNLLFVPGVAFGLPGFFRISYCFPKAVIERSLPSFTELASKFFGI